MGTQAKMSSMLKFLCIVLEVTASLAKPPANLNSPSLTELHTIYLTRTFAEAHNATVDVEATTMLFLNELTRDFTKEEPRRCDWIISKSFKIEIQPK
jgi:DNA polymerase-3 subunit alpha